MSENCFSFLGIFPGYPTRDFRPPGPMDCSLPQQNENSCRRHHWNIYITYIRQCAVTACAKLCFRCIREMAPSFVHVCFAVSAIWQRCVKHWWTKSKGISITNNVYPEKYTTKPKLRPRPSVDRNPRSFIWNWAVANVLASDSDDRWWSEPYSALEQKQFGESWRHLLTLLFPDHCLIWLLISLAVQFIMDIAVARGS